MRKRKKGVRPLFPCPFACLAGLILACGVGVCADLDQQIDAALHDLALWQIDDARAATERIEKQVKGVQPKYLYLRAMLAYYEGNYAEARAITQTAPEDVRKTDAWKEFADQVEKVYELSKTFRGKESEHFIVRFTAKDELLAEYALDALEKSYAAVGKDLQYSPKGKVIVEVYPEIQSFSTASTLKMADIQKSGAIAICHFNRIMITSPRVFVTGYTWLDTLCHEYTHYVIAKKTKNAVPVWFHEGVAKTEEERWRGESGLEMDPLSASILAEGLKQNMLVTFDEMHPTLAKLEHTRAALAYAETRTVIRFLRETYGPDSLVAVLDRSRETGDLRKAIADVTGGTFDEFYDKWLAWIRKQKLPVVPGLKPMLPKVKTGVEQEDRDLGDEVNAKAKDLVRIGDLLTQDELWEAALVEYQKAIDASGTISRYLFNRVAYALLGRRELDRAEGILLSVRKYYPDFQITYVNLARVQAARKRFDEAARYLEDALRINPFDLFARRELIDAYERLGKNDEAAKERARLARAADALFGERMAKP